MRTYTRYNYSNTAYNVVADDPIVIIIANMHWIIRHVEYLQIIYNDKYYNDNNVYKNLRVRYILSEITVEEFKVKLERYEKQKQKEEKLNNVWALTRIV